MDTGMGANPATNRQGPVYEMLSRLQSNLDELDERISVLQERVAPILSQLELRENEAKQLVAAPEAGSSGMKEQISGYCGRTYILIDRINDIIARLEV